MSNNEDELELKTGNPNYAFAQAEEALETRHQHPDADVRERAGAMVMQWLRVWHVMIAGRLNVGSRTPVKDTPARATHEDEKGGFATGGLAAGGIIQPHEQAQCERLGLPVGPSTRQQLNDYFLSDDGAAELMSMLETGRYRVDVPEEAALMAAAYFVGQNDAAKAGAILDEVMPWFDRL